MIPSLFAEQIIPNQTELPKSISQNEKRKDKEATNKWTQRREQAMFPMEDSESSITM